MAQYHNPFIRHEWHWEWPKNIPLQTNGYDCGIFTLMCLEYQSRNQRFNYDENHMPDLRRRIMFEIVQGSLLLQES